MDLDLVTSTSTFPGALRLDLGRDRRIFTLSGPIVFGMLSQTLVNLVDTAFVGKLGADALAAVGLGSVTTWLSVSVLLGIGSSTQALVARRIGENRPEETGRVLDNALVMGSVSGLATGLIVYMATPTIFALLASSDEVNRLGVDYLSMRTIGFPFVVMNFAFRGFYHGIGDTRTYLKAIALTNLLNVILDLLLIFGLLGFPRMGAKGAGLATAIALAGGTLYYLLWASWRTGIRQKNHALQLRSPSRETSWSLLAILVPNGLQGLAMALGFMIFYWMMARIDTIAVAVNSIVINVSSAFYLPALGMGLAAATLVGQSLGAGEPREAEAWGWETVRLATYVLTLAGLVMVLIPEPIVKIFTDDPAVVAAGRLALVMVGATQFATAVTMVLSNVLVSAGSAKFVMLVNVSVTFLVVLPLTYVLAVTGGGGVALAWLLQGFGRLVIGIILVFKFRAGGWKQSEL